MVLKMSKMFPTYKNYESPISELGLFETFQNKLDDNFYVFHSVKYLLNEDKKKKTADKIQRIKEGEIDFLILHPKYGLLVIEVKGGREINYNGEENQWYSLDYKGNNHQIKDPYFQGSRQSHEIMKYLKHTSIPGFDPFKMPFGHAVIFPGISSLLGYFPPHVEKWFTLTSNDLDDIENKIITIMKRWGQGKNFDGIKSKVMKQLISQTLIPKFKLIYSVGEHIRDQDKIIWEMTQQQFNFINFIENHNRACIQGFAGTGKTVLAQEKARRAAQHGKKVLLLCFNKYLKNFLVKSLSEFDGDITVNNFHSLCWHYIKESGQEFNPPSDNLQHFWNEEVPLMMIQALENITERFDTIIIDEAQDFSDNWMIVIEELLFSKENGELYIFSDPQQDIFHRSGHSDIIKSPFKLYENCRNTQEITKLISKIIQKNISNPVNHPTGAPVIFKSFKNKQEELIQLESLLNTLINTEKIPATEIVMLSYYQQNNTCLADTETINNYKITDSPNNAHKKQLRFSTVSSFKGLEANVVILIDVDEFVADKIMKNYVASSRARHLLYIFKKTGVTTVYDH